MPEAEATLFALAKRALLCGKPGYGAGFVCVRGDGTAVCWGHVPPAPPLGGVRQLVASARAFAAVMEDGSVASWGQREFGADSLELRPLLCGVVSLAASLGAFAALREDGQVVSWGNPLYGGHRGVPLGGVVAVTASAEAFAATTKEGRVVCWGHPESGGCAKRVQVRGIVAKSSKMRGNQENAAFFDGFEPGAAGGCAQGGGELWRFLCPDLAGRGRLGG